MASSAGRMKRLRRVGAWLFFAVAMAVSWLGLWLQVQVNGGMARPAWVPDVAGLSTVSLFARIGGSLALCGLLLLVLHPARQPGMGAGGAMPRVMRRRLTLPSLRRTSADATAQTLPAGNRPDPLDRLGLDSDAAATVRQRQVARRARDIIAARQVSAS